MKKLTCSAAVLLAVLLTAVPAVASGDGPTVCESTFEEPFTGEAGDLVVEEGTVCFLEGALVHGNAVAKPGAELNIGPGTTIEGNVDAYEGSFTGSFEASIGRSYRCHDCVFEDVVFSSVGKNVEIRGTDDGDFIVGSTIGGNLEIVGSAAGAFVFAVLGNTVAGNVTLRDNEGAFAIEDNSIGGQLTVSGNEILESQCTPGDLSALRQRPHRPQQGRPERGGVRQQRRAAVDLGQRDHRRPPLQRERPGSFGYGQLGQAEARPVPRPLAGHRRSEAFGARSHRAPGPA